MKHLLTVFSFIILLAPVFVLAQYQPLVGIPGVSDPQNFDEYLQSIYATAISLAALLAVIKIVIAGVKWMTTDIVTSKSDAKKDIEGAVFGLLIILGAVLILYIINPDIGDVDLTFAPPPRAEAPAGSILNAQVAACQASPETCKFEVVSCKISSGTNRGRAAADPVYDCTFAQARCMGTSAVSPNGTALACLTDLAAEETNLAAIAAANCPSGDTCSAYVCTSDNCERDCTEDGGVRYDPATNTCTVSVQGVIDRLNTEITTVLDGATLRPRLVSDAAIKNEFSSLVGASQTYYLAELPSLSRNENLTVIATMRDVCQKVAEREDRPSIETVDDTIDAGTPDATSYVGCVRP